MKGRTFLGIGVGISGLLLLVLSYYLKTVFLYDFFHREQQQLFLFDGDYLLDLIAQPGGAALCLARFFVQFFYSGVLSAFLTSLLFSLIAFFLIGIIDRLGGEWSLFPLSLYPIGALLLSLLDSCFFYEGVTSYLFVTGGLYLYLSLKQISVRQRVMIGLLLTLFLFVTAGAVASLFACCAFLSDGVMRRDKYFYSFLYLPFALLLGGLAVQAGMIAQWMQSCTVANYYEWTLEMPEYHHLSWVLLLLLPLVVSIYQALSMGKRNFLQIVVSFVLLVGVIRGYQSIQSQRFDPLRSASYQYEYFTVTKQWKALQKEASRQLQHYNGANYLNLALAEQGVLLDHLFTYPQYGPQSLVYIPNNKSSDVRLAHLWFAMGNMAAAQNVAFNSLFALNGYNPTMLQMLVQIELMRGNYPVALKYIVLLEKTIHYADWATAQRRFLFDDEAVSQDPLLGVGRASFPSDDSFVLLASPMDDLYKIVAANPSNTKAVQYALAYLLLAKDFNHIQSFIDAYYGTPALQRLAKPVQEALLFFSDYYHTLEKDYAIQHGISGEQLSAFQQIDWEYCKAHGVESSTFDRFVQFKKGYEQVRQGAPHSLLDAFKHTFWYYLLFVEIG